MQPVGIRLREQGETGGGGEGGTGAKRKIKGKFGGAREISIFDLRASHFSLFESLRRHRHD